MDSDKLKAIAEQSGTTVATARRVLNHCSGIAAETRDAVIRAQCALNHPIALGERRLHLILPDNPKFFWHKALHVLNGYYFDPPVKLSFYPSLPQSTQLTAYLEPLRDVDGNVLILAADLDHAQQETVARIAEHSLVIQLCHHTPLPNTVYVGSDAYADGYVLGESVVGHGCKKAVMLRRRGSHTIRERCRGFADGFGSSVIEIDEPEDNALYPSLVARAIAPLDGVDLVFSAGGRTAETCRALYKLRSGLRCLGFELSPQLQKMTEKSAVLALMNQDIAAQTRTALELAIAYLRDGTRPTTEYCTIPSKLIETV